MKNLKKIINNILQKNFMRRAAIWSLLVVLISALGSCKDFLNIDPPSTSLSSESVFSNDDSAIAALTNIYSALTAPGSYISGGNQNIGILAGLSADEYLGYSSNLNEFYENQINPINTPLTSIYTTSYTSVFGANSVLEGLENSNKITPAIKSQLQGEAYFLRAFSYFYLTNLFGAVPLQLSTDYRITRSESKSSPELVFFVFKSTAS